MTYPLLSLYKGRISEHLKTAGCSGCSGYNLHIERLSATERWVQRGYNWVRQRRIAGTPDSVALAGVGLPPGAVPRGVAPLRGSRATAEAVGRRRVVAPGRSEQPAQPGPDHPASAGRARKAAMDVVAIARCCGTRGPRRAGAPAGSTLPARLSGWHVARLCANVRGASRRVLPGAKLGRVAR